MVDAFPNMPPGGGDGSGGTGGDGAGGNHIHHAGCGCSEEMRRQDPYGQDLFEFIDKEAIQCFNERKVGMCKDIVRPLEDKNKGPEGAVLRSGYGKDMVIVVPFSCEVRVKSIIMISGDNGEAPKELKLYKNEEAVDVNIQEDKAPLQKMDLNQGEVEYATNLMKFSNVSNIVLGLDGTFGAKKSSLKYLGFKGDKLRNKVKVVETVYEVRAQLKDHEVPEDKEKNFGNMGL